MLEVPLEEASLFIFLVNLQIVADNMILKSFFM